MDAYDSILCYSAEAVAVPLINRSYADPIVPSIEKFKKKMPAIMWPAF